MASFLIKKYQRLKSHNMIQLIKDPDYIIQFNIREDSNKEFINRMKTIRYLRNGIMVIQQEQISFSI